MSLWLLDLIALLPSKWQEWILPPSSITVVENSPTKVQLSRITHVYFEHADLEAFTGFAEDFGFVEAARKGKTIYYRGYGRDPYVYVASQSSARKSKFLGAAFAARDEENFTKAAAMPGAFRKTLVEAPGGGEIVTFTRPNGTLFHVVWGQIERDVEVKSTPTATHDFQGPFNTPFEKPRKGQFQRYHDGPALVHKLGHYGYVCKDFETELEFYTCNFNFVHSDILYLPKFRQMDVMTFMHLDLGEDYTDHHTFFLQRASPTVRETYVHHTSFEVADFDTQLMGHHYLAKKGWKSVWGVGRHILGSQIFDYWYDTSKFKIEHYADGDVVNRYNVTRREPVGPLSIWGPELPRDFGANKAG
ncbi:2,4,5-trihydroxytoluene oxygenase [Aspergillus candidus]|uniref:Glyoxalase/Bleomycin resistance protein/Dihydroxybiphenyl dioxygenase n=1 Tax=Aspergillus candidus TaxID=41067 RepID=A0A2I2F604_ASPCN|nr:Glyoxalase/Bleomycin resistance protein/Dihydroxybiphenyl dioxygenase [Aspergillus candidus]PLB36084.1 Glyoxalase/Bleomycin resistance protein/Dihydroxybiphenyl dioxygenase [Aspergillus candidus]